MNSAYADFIRSMVRGGYQRVGKGEEDEHGFRRLKYSNERILKIAKASPFNEFIETQQAKWVGHVARKGNDAIQKHLMFENAKGKKTGAHPSTYKNVLKRYKSNGKSEDWMLRRLVQKEYGYHDRPPSRPPPQRRCELAHTTHKPR